MPTTRVTLALLLFGASLVSFAAQPAARPTAGNSEKLPLADGWAIRSSCETQATKSDAISRAGFHEDGWLATRVPSTVMAAQVAAGKFEDPFFGLNLRKIPGMDYPQKELYANLPVLATSPYKCSWWYRKDFDIPAAWTKRRCGSTSTESTIAAISG